MDKEARLSSARKKLKDFRRKREVKTSNTKHPDISEKASPSNNNVNLSDVGYEEKSTHDLSSSTAVNTESILQVSSTLTGLIAEVESLTENGTSNGNIHEILEENSSKSNLTHVGDTIKDLQKRNVELSERLGTIEVEREQLFAQCQNLSDQLQTLTAKNSQVGDVHERLETQKQTIEILVSEKQDLQRELLDVKSKAESRNAEQMMLQETLQKYKRQAEMFEEDVKGKVETINLMEATLGPLKEAHTNSTEEISKLRQELEREKLQTTELGMKLRMKETECNELSVTHNDLQEKLSMAEVLLQQYSVRKEGTSDIAQLEQEIRRLSQELINSQQSLEKLADERHHLQKQHADAQNDWENHVQRLQSEIQTLNDSLREQSSKLVESIPEEESSATTAPDLKQTIEETCTFDQGSQTENFMEEKISTLLNDNKHLSQLLQEKELRISELENEVHDAQNALQDHANLMDSARNDKVTISRALTQNKQLKEQLEEIQNSFISVSNDKMDLATELSSMEAVNKSLSGRLQEITSAFNIVKQELDEQKLQMQEITSSHQPEISESISHEQEMATAMNSEPTVESVVESATMSEVNESSADTSSVLLESSHQGPDEVIPAVVGNVESVTPSSEHGIGDPKMMVKLQEKFTAVMQERADLMNRVEMLEHANTQLQNECDTIGEYITLYHSQRQLLKQRHQEKDDYISTIIQEREEMRGKVEQLQTLVSTVLRPSHGSVSSKTSHIADFKEISSSQESLNSDSVGPDVLPQPDLVPKSDVSISEPDVSASIAPSASYDVSSQIDNGVKDAAAHQILALLSEMQKPVEQSPVISSRPSGFCMHYIGPYTAI